MFSREEVLVPRRRSGWVREPGFPGPEEVACVRQDIMRFPKSSQMSFGEGLRVLMGSDLFHQPTVKVAKGANVYNCGQRDSNFYLIDSGSIKTVTFSKAGKECLLSIYSAGAVFGELCLALAERTETATAMKTTVLKKIPSEKLLPALIDSGLLRDFIYYLTLRLFEQQQTIANLVMMDSEQRLAAVLLQLARNLGKRSGACIRIEDRITQEELSLMVGTTRSRVGHFLKGFREAGMVEPIPRSFLMVHEERLTALIEKEH